MQQPDYGQRRRVGGSYSIQTALRSVNIADHDLRFLLDITERARKTMYPPTKVAIFGHLSSGTETGAQDLVQLPIGAALEILARETCIGNSALTSQFVDQDTTTGALQ
jgi:hypothetical protein